MKKILLTQGQNTLVNDKDYDYLIKWKWYAKKSTYSFYAARNEYKNGKQITIRMHRVIMNTPLGMETDHKDRNGLNNQRYNLHIVTRLENNNNKRTYKTNKSGFSGVYWHKKAKRWVATFRNKHLGQFLTKKEAINCRKKYAKN